MIRIKRCHEHSHLVKGQLKLIFNLVTIHQVDNWVFVAHTNHFTCTLNPHSNEIDSHSYFQSISRVLLYFTNNAHNMINIRCVLFSWKLWTFLIATIWKDNSEFHFKLFFLLAINGTLLCQQQASNQKKEKKSDYSHIRLFSQPAYIIPSVGHSHFIAMLDCFYFVQSFFYVLSKYLLLL